jgi:hypothetical protein
MKMNEREKLEREIEETQRKIEKKKEHVAVLRACRGKPDGVGIAAGVIMTEEELDRKIESGEITEENFKEALDAMIIKYPDGTYGVFDPETPDEEEEWKT